MKPGAPVLVAVSLTLVAAHRAGPARPALEEARSTVQAAAGALDRAVSRPAAALTAALGQADRLARENARLRLEVAAGRGWAAQADALARDNAVLAGLSGVAAAGPLPAVAARVVALPGGRGGPLLLGRGSEAGIAPGMPVVAAGALVGRVVEASAGRARVLPITDPASSVGVRLAESGEVGVVAGGQGWNLRLELLQPDAEADGGALVVTAGLAHGRYPPALPVGRVRSGGREVTPLAPLTRLAVVEVLAWTPPG